MNKCIAVINSCRTKQQLHVARRYIMLYCAQLECLGNYCYAKLSLKADQKLKELS